MGRDAPSGGGMQSAGLLRRPTRPTASRGTPRSRSSPSSKGPPPSTRTPTAGELRKPTWWSPSRSPSTSRSPLWTISVTSLPWTRASATPRARRCQTWRTSVMTRWGQRWRTTSARRVTVTRRQSCTPRATAPVRTWRPLSSRARGALWRSQPSRRSTAPCPKQPCRGGGGSSPGSRWNGSSRYRQRQLCRSCASGVQCPGRLARARRHSRTRSCPGRARASHQALTPPKASALWPSSRGRVDRRP
mmetsp:Transcript_68863/g.190652  ORF Transcript_68863/g.190652 Transcript_68863/m.190652 type:complete len:246 (-) Transcript_68863:103-840(-)